MKEFRLNIAYRSGNFSTVGWVITTTLRHILVFLASAALLPALAVAGDDIATLSSQADVGSVSAMVRLAEMYSAGEKVALDPQKAFAWYLKAAEQGNARAQTEIGVLFELGKGVAPDPEAAARWYRKAADQGLARAQTDLGSLYETGNGVMLDYRQAAHWYSLAAGQGHARGQVFLGALYEKGLGLSHDPAKALSWYQEAANQGYSRGQLELGRLYETGIGVEQDRETALNWYHKAARQGYPPAQKRIKDLGDEGNNGPRGDEPAPARMTWQAPVLDQKAVITINELARYELRQAGAAFPGKDPGESGSALLNEVMQLECSDYNLQYLEKNVLQAQAEATVGDLGLEFETGYRMRDNADTVDTNRQHAYAGLSWYLLKEGLRENQSDSKRYQCQQEIAETRAEQERHRELFNCRDSYLIQYFNALKQALLTRRHEVLSHYFELARADYFLNYRGVDELFKIELELRKTAEAIKNYEILDQEVIDQGQFASRQLPAILDLNLSALLKAIDADPSYDKMAALSQTILEEKYDPLRDKRLRLFVETDIMEDTTFMSSGGILGGVAFSTPIFVPTPRVLPIEIQRAKATFAKERETTRLEVARLTNAYGEKQIDAIKMVYRQQIVSERLRQALLAIDPATSQPGQDQIKTQLLVIELLQELLDVRVELAAVAESLYRHLLHTLTLTRVGWREEFTKTAALDFNLRRGRTGQRAVYIWSKAFAGSSNQFLAQLLKAKGITTVIISAASTMDQHKLADFIKLAEINQVKVELMLSETNWVRPEKWPEVESKLDQLQAFAGGISAIHLDIEPHTLPDYHANKALYNQAFLEVITKVRALTVGDQGLAVSLPILHDPEFISAVSAQVDRIYIMAYGKTDQQTLTRKLTPFAQINPDRLTLAVRPGDFSSEVELERYIDRASRDHGLKAFAYHELSQFLHLAGQGPL